MASSLKNLGWLTLLLLAVSCSPLSRRIEQQALQVPFPQLMEETSRYEGELVVLGGYVIKTNIKSDGTTELVVLQTPLSFGDRPQDKDKSRGRFMVVYGGYLDPEVYSQGRAVTVAGTVLGKSVEKKDECPYGCLVLQSQEIYLWPERRYYPPAYPYYYGPYDPFWDYPYAFRRPFYYPNYPFGPRYYPPYWW